MLYLQAETPPDTGVSAGSRRQRHCQACQAHDVLFPAGDGWQFACRSQHSLGSELTKGHQHRAHSEPVVLAQNNRAELTLWVGLDVSWAANATTCWITTKRVSVALRCPAEKTGASDKFICLQQEVPTALVLCALTTNWADYRLSLQQHMILERSTNNSNRRPDQ